MKQTEKWYLTEIAKGFNALPCTNNMGNRQDEQDLDQARKLLLQIIHRNGYEIGATGRNIRKQSTQQRFIEPVPIPELEV